ncbi:DUF1592 domain-containing protein [uncultured Gimesia sp.]|uniref:DUF1592 domain-containing protein n=1 Tax=uncultured Gimesia sp. TaxID=1678688 RepID=UPI0030D87D14|tara:strand:- start:92928 stop:95588 length:2661 start_codon:yes stop_codon:yes gene_type:complete
MTTSLRRFVVRKQILVCLPFFFFVSIGSLAAAAPRVSRDLQVLYTFDAGQGALIRDRSGVGQPLDLKIEKPKAVQWKQGALVVRASTKINSAASAKKIINPVKRANSLTVEAWISPANDRQKGPARIISLSGNSSQRNLTLGQEGKQYDVRLRTTSTSTNGLPSTATPNKFVKTALTHVVYTRDTQGTARIYINGQQQAQQMLSGKLSNWDNDFGLILANEKTGGRPWLGEFHLVAIFSRALTDSEVKQNFRAGTTSKTNSAETKAALAAAEARHEFETQVAPLLARNCLDCHDSAAKKGQLDLSRKVAAFAGGESGKAIVPGKAGESLLWEQIKTGAMPPEGEPLTKQEKTLLKQWIDKGAAWSIEMIDPAVYVYEGRAGAVWLQRLTVPEYIETVRSAVGVDIAREARELLPPDLRADGFSNTAYNLNVDLKHVEIYARLAEIIVERMDVMKFAGRFSKSRKLSTDATMRKFIADMGKWLFRGPLEDREVTTYSGIATTVASAGGNYQEAVSLTIEAMLQSPRFIYRIENQRGDGSAWPADDYELASRMSYIIWGGPPDQELMRAADAGELHNRAKVEKQARRMLQDPRAVNRSLQFLSEWLNLNRLSNLRPDRKKFPHWNVGLAADMRDETQAFFKEIVWEQNRPLSDLLNAQLTYATPGLAAHYGLKPKGTGLKRYDLSSVPARGGLLTQGSVLTVGGDEASMVTRGLFVLHGILRGVVKDPPPGLDITPVPSKPGLSQRRIAEQRLANVSCSGCHVRFEPLAFGLEKYDGLGAFHERDEHGNQLREDGEILFPGAAKPVSYETSAALMNLMAESPRVQESITWKVTQFALGRPLVASDARILDQIHKAAQKKGGTYSSLITAIVLSDLVQMTRTEPNSSEK